MCGIIYVQGPNSESKARKCLQVVGHRGPDQSVVVTISHVSIGFCRLAINDAENGMQPFEHNGKIGVFNAEIYNYLEIKQKHQIQTHSESDCEVILPLWCMYGKNMFKELNGFYSGIIFDTVEKTVHVIRDRVGKKPLFYVQVGNTEYVVSELKAIPQEVEFFTMLPKGLSRIGNREVIQIHDIGQVHRTKGIQSKHLPLIEIMKHAVHKRLRATCAWRAVFLSGGLDSSIVAVIASQSNFKERIKYYYLAGSEFEDYSYVLEILKHLDIPDQQIVSVPLPNESEIIELLAKVVYHTESYNPSIVSNGLGMFLLAQRAQQDGIKVALTGDGADEVFLGYFTKQQINENEYKDMQKLLIEGLQLTEMRRVDMSSMAHGVEVRCPFLDSDVITYALSLEYIDFFGNEESTSNKYILRKEFAKVLPSCILRRKKTPFDVGTGLQKMLINVAKKRGIHEKKLYSDIWQEYFLQYQYCKDNPYFWSYPPFNKYFDEREKKWGI